MEFQAICPHDAQSLSAPHCSDPLLSRVTYASFTWVMRFLHPKRNFSCFSDVCGLLQHILYSHRLLCSSYPLEWLPRLLSQPLKEVCIPKGLLCPVEETSMARPKQDGTNKKQTVEADLHLVHSCLHFFAQENEANLAANLQADLNSPGSVSHQNIFLKRHWPRPLEMSFLPTAKKMLCWRTKVFLPHSYQPQLEVIINRQ